LPNNALTGNSSSFLPLAIAAMHEFRPVVQRRHKQMGRAGPLCPGNSDIHLLDYGKRVVYFDSKIANGAFDLCMPEQQLDRSKISCTPID
jgi:hypothetical protein